jgi:hypothetical protein
MLDLDTAMEYDEVLGVNLHRGFRAAAVELLEVCGQLHHVAVCRHT